MTEVQDRSIYLFLAGPQLNCHRTGLTAVCVMMKMTVKKELGLDDAEADDRLTQLATLLPGLLPRLPTIKAANVVTLAQDIPVSCLFITGLPPLIHVNLAHE